MGIPMHGDKSAETGESNEGPVTVRDYHQRSKHHIGRYAAGPGTIDWDNQPNPFRRFDGAEVVELPLVADSIGCSYADLYDPPRAGKQVLDQRGIAALLELSLGLSAWKQYGDARWSLRCNPSSGNLHPTEAYIAAIGLPDLADGIYHYAPEAHALEQRCRFRLDNSSPGRGLLLGLSTIHWREAWKYGERAWRYCQLDTGHALAAVAYASAALGWRATLLDHWSDEDVARLLGLDRDRDFADSEREVPELLLWITDETESGTGEIEAETWLSFLDDATWSGIANRLDPKPLYQWPVIEEVSAITRKPATDQPDIQATTPSTLTPMESTLDAAMIIRQRRSAQAFDGKTAMSSASFFRMLDCLQSRPDLPPWFGFPLIPRIHLLFFVHRVTGLEPGLYFLPRRQDAETELRQQLRQEFKWQKLDDCPEHLPLYHLLSANCQNAARTVSCHQDIASDSCFSLAMLAEYDAPLETGDWNYRRLYWEAGVIGQVLYLEAEAAGLRGTGIGCFFDNAVHDILGIKDTRLQDLYHFTVGAPIVDPRLISLPPYGHRRK